MGVLLSIDLERATMKVALNLLILCVVIIGGADLARSQTPSKALINPPGWILAEWTNMLESNANEIETITFAPGEINFSKGIADKRKVLNLSSKFKNYQTKETVEPKTYRVEFLRGENVFVYEFKLNDASPGFSGREVLTYSITKNQKVVETHWTRFFKPMTAK